MRQVNSKISMLTARLSALEQQTAAAAERQTRELEAGSRARAHARAGLALVPFHEPMFCCTDLAWRRFVSAATSWSDSLKGKPKEVCLKSFAV